MKLSRFRELFGEEWQTFLVDRRTGVELLADIDAEIAKARSAGGSNIDRRVSSLAGGLDDVERRLSALEASEITLREHCQGNVPMSVFSDLRKRVDSLSSDSSSLENATTCELRALAERVAKLEAPPQPAQSTETVAWNEWHAMPWGESGLESVSGGAVVYSSRAVEIAFRSGFRAGRK